MDYIEMLIQNNNDLFSGKTPFYAEISEEVPEQSSLYDTDEEEYNGLYDGYYGYGNNNGKFTDDEYEELFPGVLRPKKYDYSKKPESETYETLYDDDGFAIMETVGDRTQDKYRYRDKSYAEIKAMYAQENREILNDLLGVEDAEIPGVMSRRRKRYLVKKFKQDPMWFMTKKERIDMMIDDNIQEQSTYNATNFVYQYVYDYTKLIDEAIWYRTKKYILDTDWFQSLDLWECLEFNMIFNYEMYLRPDKNPMNKNKKKMYDEAIARFRKDHDVAAFFDGILDASSGAQFSKLKHLEIAMLEAANANSGENNDLISGLLNGSIEDAVINNNCISNIFKDGPNPPIPDRVVLRGDKFPDEITDPKEIQKHLLSEIDDVDMEKIKVKAAATMEIEQDRARRLAEKIIENNRPKSIYELLGVEFDIDDELSVAEATERMLNVREKIKTDYTLLADGNVILLKPLHLWMTNRQIKAEYPEKYEELVRNKVIEPVLEEWLEDEKIKDMRNKRLVDHKEDIEVIEELEGKKINSDEDIDKIIARINERHIGDSTVIEMPDDFYNFEEPDTMSDGKENILGKLIAMREKREGIKNDYIGTRRYTEPRVETPEELKARFMSTISDTINISAAALFNSEHKVSLDDYTFEELQEAILMRDEGVMELFDEIPYKERYEMLKKLRPDYTALNIPDCETDRDDDLTTEEILEGMDMDIRRAIRMAQEDPDINNPLEEHARDILKNIHNEMTVHADEHEGQDVFDVMREIYY